MLKRLRFFSGATSTHACKIDGQKNRAKKGLGNGRIGGGKGKRTRRGRLRIKRY